MLVVGYLIIAYVVIGSYLQIPKEDPETIAARKTYGKFKY